MLLQPSLARHKIQVDLDLPEPDPVLDMDEQLIRKMIIHLTRNGIEAMPEGGEVTIFVGRLGQLNADLRRQGLIDELLGRSEDSSRRQLPATARR